MTTYYIYKENNIGFWGAKSKCMRVPPNRHTVTYIGLYGLENKTTNPSRVSKNSLNLY